MKQKKKFQSQEHQHSEIHSQMRTEKEGHEFTSAEEMLRFDAQQTVVPPEIAQRLNRSLQKEPVRPQSWWRRILG